MIYLKKVIRFSTYTLHSKKGFTLIELMIALAITSVLLLGVYSAYSIQQRSYKTQRLIVSVQQNLRGALAVMEDEIRMAGYDSNTPHTGFFGITNITIDGNGNGTLEFTGDFGGAGSQNNGTLDGNETFQYTIADLPIGSPDGILDLAREAGSGRQLLAEGIEAMGFAFAFDGNDADNQLDTDAGTGAVLWGFDSDGDNVLDANVAGGGLPSSMNMDRIRAVRIWVLARTKGNVPNHTDTGSYFIGIRTVPAFNDNCRRILLTSTINCRNMGL